MDINMQVFDTGWLNAIPTAVQVTFCNYTGVHGKD